MKMTDILGKVEQLQNSSNEYFIDYLPKTVTSKDYFEFEEYFMNTFLQSFSEKVIRLVFKVMCYYEAELRLSELPCEYFGLLSNYDVGKNIRKLPLTEISSIINEVIVRDISSVQILLKADDYCNICISGGFSVNVYST